MGRRDMGRKWSMAFLGMLLSLAACVSTVHGPEEARDEAELTYDRYEAIYWVRGSRLWPGIMPLETYFNLRGGFGRDGGYSFVQIYVEHLSSSGSLWFNHASDATATPLVLHYIKRHREKRITTEEVAVDLPRRYLLAHQGKDLDIRVSGPGGGLVLRVPAAYVQGFLERFDAELAKVASK